MGVKKVTDGLELFATNESEAENPLNKMYFERMKKFADQSQKKLGILEEEMEEMNKSFKNLAKQYGEDAEVLQVTIT